MVTASQLQAASSNNYKYALSNDQYKALANEQNTQQQQGKALTTEEAYRQRKGVSTEKASSAQPAQAAQAAAQPAATQSAPVAQVTQSAAPINKTSGLPQGETFQYTLSHAQQNKYVRENQSRVAQGKAALTELQFRQNIEMDTSTVNGSYTAPKVTNNSYTAATPATSTKDVGSTNKAATGSGDQKIAAQKAANSGNSNASAVSGTPQQAQASVISANETAKRNAAVKAENDRIAQQAKIDAQNAANAKRAAAQEAAAKEKAATAARAEASKTANANVKAAATKRANELQKQADAAKKAAKAAEDDADAKAKLANVYGEASYYSEIAARTGNAAAARKAAVAVKGIKSVKAEVQKTSARAKALGVTSHEGQILLKDGTYINQVERKGNGGKGEREVTVSTESAKTIAAKKKAKAQKDAAEAAQAEKNYQKIIGNQGQILDAIEGKGQKGVGEAAVVYLSTNKKTGTTYAKSGKQYTDEQSERKRLTNKSLTVITPEMTVKQIEKALTKNATIQAARDETADRKASTFRSAVLSIDPKTGAMKLKAAQGKASDMGAFKTVDQLRTEKLLKSDSALVRASISANQKFMKVASYENVTSTVSREKQKLDAKYAGRLPSLSKIEKSRNAAFTKVGLEDERLTGQKAIYGNKYGKAAMNLGTDAYDSLNMHPVSAAATVAGIYASGVIGGVLIEGALGAGAAGAGAIALKTSSKAVKTGAEFASKYIPTAGRGLLGLSVLNEGAKVAVSGEAAKTVKFVVDLAIGGAGYAKGAKLAKEPFSILPGVKKIKVQVPSIGASSGVANVPIGTSLVLRGKPILSYSREGGLVKGVAKIPASKVKKLEIQAFDSLGTKSFEKSLTALVNANDVAKYQSGKAMTDAVYGQKSPITSPKTFEIKSASIPVKFRPLVKNIVKDYPGVLKIYSLKAFGSNVMKQQLGGLFSRTPHDLELNLDSGPRFAKMFRKQAAKAGFKEGVDYKISGTTNLKVMFPEVKKAGAEGEWDAGIEVFENKQLMKDKKVKSGPAKGYETSVEHDIAWGFKRLNPDKIEGIKVMKLQEQAAAKFAGATRLREGRLEPTHRNRLKDLHDLVEITTAYEVTEGIGQAKNILTYVNAYKKSPEMKTATGFESAEKPKSVIVDFIAEKQRLPTVTEIKTLISAGELSTTEASVVLKFKKEVTAPQSKESASLLRRYKSAIKTAMEGKKANGTSSTAAKTTGRERARDASVRAKKAVHSKREVTSETGKTTAGEKPQPRFRKKSAVKGEKELLYESTSLGERLRGASKGLSSKSAVKRRAVTKSSLAPSKASPEKQGLSKPSTSKPRSSEGSSKMLSSKPSAKPSSANSGSKPSSRAGSKPSSANSGSKPSSKPSSRPGSKPSSRPSSSPSSKPGSKPGSKPNSRPSSKPESKPSSKPSSKPESKPNSKPNSKPGSKPGSSGTTTKKVYHTTEVDAKIARKRKQTQENKIKSVKDMVRLTRRLQNQLGSLDSMFDTPAKKSTKRTVKRVSRA